MPSVRALKDFGSGWAMVGDLLLCLPLSVFVQFTQINYRVSACLLSFGFDASANDETTPQNLPGFPTGGRSGGIHQRPCETALPGPIAARPDEKTAALQKVTPPTPPHQPPSLLWLLHPLTCQFSVPDLRKYIFGFHENLQKLVYMGLLHFAPTEKFKEKDQVCRGVLIHHHHGDGKVRGKVN